MTEVSVSAQLAVNQLFPITRAGTCHGLAGFFPYRVSVRLNEGDLMELRFALTPKDARSDDTDVHYEYRAPQRANGAPAVPTRNQPYPCGSGKKYKRCCGLRARSASGS